MGKRDGRVFTENLRRSVVRRRKETVQFQFVERDDGSISINAFTFKNSASPVPAPDHELSPAVVRAMPVNELVQRTSRYAEKVCIRCHLDIRRRLFEPENFGRRFEADPKWAFRTTAQRTQVLNKLDGLFRTFADGDARTNPLYKWLWGDGKELKASDTFQHQAFAREAMIHNAREMFDRLKLNLRWQENAAAFSAAVNSDAQLDRVLIAKGQTKTQIVKARREAELFLAQINLKYARKLNQENIAWILAAPKHDELPHYAGNDYLLLNADSIRAIGPSIFELLVTDAQWAMLDSDARLTHVRLRDLNVKDISELARLVLTPEARRNAKRTADTYLVLVDILQNKNKAMAHFSGSLGVNAITVGQGLNILDLYAKNLADCRSDLTVGK